MCTGEIKHLQKRSWRKRLASTTNPYRFDGYQNTNKNTRHLTEELAKLKDAVQSKESKLVQDLAERENTQKALQTLMQEKDALVQVQQELEKQLEESKDAFEQVYKVQTENETLKEMLEQMKQEMDQIEAVNQLSIELPKVKCGATCL
jgi:chromosome segregation ATPase